MSEEPQVQYRRRTPDPAESGPDALAAPAVRTTPEKGPDVDPFARVPKRRSPEDNVLPRSGETITVACKIPQGLVLRLWGRQKQRQAGPGNTWVDVEVPIPLPEHYVLEGPAIDVARLQATQDMPKVLIGGYALTSGIPKDFWEEWYRGNHMTDLVQNGLVFAAATDARARAQAKEMGPDFRSGLEPIDPDKPNLRMPPSPFGNIRIERGTRT